MSITFSKTIKQLNIGCTAREYASKQNEEASGSGKLEHAIEAEEKVDLGWKEPARRKRKTGDRQSGSNEAEVNAEERVELARVSMRGLTLDS